MKFVQMPFSRTIKEQTSNMNTKTIFNVPNMNMNTHTPYTIKGKRQVREENTTAQLPLKKKEEESL